MKINKLKKIICMLLVLVLTASAALFTVTADELDDAKALEEQNAEFEKQISEEQGKIAELEANIGTLQANIEALDAEIEKIEGIIEDYRNKQAEKQAVVDELNSQIEAMEADIVQKENDIADQYGFMKKRIRFMYENVNENYIEAIFSSRTFSEAVQKVEYLLEVTNYNRRMMEKIKGLKVEVQENKGAVEKQRNEVQVQIEELESLKAAEAANEELLAQARALKEEELETVKGELYDIEVAIAEMTAAIESNREAIENYKAEYDARMEREAEERRQKALEEARQKLIEEGGSEEDFDEEKFNEEYIPTGDGGFCWPLPSGYTSVTSWYGYRGDDEDVMALGSGDGFTYHNGIDFNAGVGTPIYAVQGGIVEVVDYMPGGFGNYIIIYHGDGIYTHVHHLSDFAVSEGEVVTQGQLIGYVGATGACTGPHLHFGVCIGSEYNFTDPCPFLGM